MDKLIDRYIVWLSLIILVLFSAHSNAQEIPDRDLAFVIDQSKLAEASYHSDAKQIGKWTRIDTNKYGSITGLNYSLYKRKTAGGKIELSLSFAGTEWLSRYTKFPDLSDAITDIDQATDLRPGKRFIKPAQYKEALKVAEHIIKNMDSQKDVSLVVTGHSLGGGIAQYVSYNTGVRAVVFNSAPLSSSTLKTLFPENDSAREALANSSVINVRMKGDVVSASPGIQFGRQYSLEAAPGTPDVYPTGVQKPPLGLGGGHTEIKDRWARHDMGNLSKSLEYHKAYERISFQAANIGKGLNLPRSFSGTGSRSWWVYETSKKSKEQLFTEINAVSSIASRARKVIVVGSGMGADKMYAQMSKRIGQSNVMRITNIPDKAAIDQKVKSFNAELVLGVRPSSHTTDIGQHMLVAPKQAVVEFANTIQSLTSIMSDLKDAETTPPPYTKPKEAFNAMMKGLRNAGMSGQTEQRLRNFFGPANNKWITPISEIVSETTNLIIALDKDRIRITDTRYMLTRSHTLEQIGKTGLRIALKVAEIQTKHGTLTSFAGKPYMSDVGIVDIVTGVAKGIGKGRVDLEVASHIVEGVNSAAWYTVGLLTSGGNHKVAQAYQAAGELAAKAGQHMTIKHFTQFHAHKYGHIEIIGDQWKDAMESNLARGVEITRIEDWCDKDALKMFNKSDVVYFNNQYEEMKSRRPFDTSLKSVQIPLQGKYEPTARDMSNAEIATDLATQNSKRTIIFGKGAAAEKSYENARKRLGSDNVRWVRDRTTHYQQRQIAERFRADSIIRTSSQSWREVTHHGYKTVTPITSNTSAYNKSIIRPAELQQSYRQVPVSKPRLATQSFKQKELQLPRKRDVYPPQNQFSWVGGGDGPPPTPSVNSFDRTGTMSFSNSYRQTPFSHNFNPVSYQVGGVMLRGTASVTGTDAELGAGSFALLFENGDAGMDIGELRKFVTALWSVYFSKEGPGISIDPIAPGIDKHIVRYIGQVVNSDLGRVMREADYTMKKWAVGTERPDLPGFKNPDDIAGQKGVIGAEAWSRFWFVPEDMRFRSSGDTLLFDGGRMTLRTEYLSSSNQHGKVDKANEQFAADFTENYPLVAGMYIEYKELFEYAKMVSFAKYLKENGVPMLWYLLANKDMILTEDSKGTVDALATKSKYFQDVEITGGVDLAAGPSSDHYVIDAEAAKALAEAWSRYGSSPNSTTIAVSEPVVFKAGEDDFTLVTPHSVALSSSAVAGETFQTDIALRLKGEPALELARYYNSKHQDIATFGDGWHLMIPYRLKPEDEKKIPFSNLMIPERMVVENLLSGRQEVLTFNRDRYRISGYVPEHADQSGIVGLFWLTDGSLRLADKVGSEFQFDPTGRLTDMILTKDYIVSYKYGYEVEDAQAFQRPPFRIEAVGTERVSALNVSLPKYMRLLDNRGRLRETFIFDKNNDYDLIGYSPVSGKNSNYRFLSLLSNTSFKLEDNRNRLMLFDSAGQFEKIQGPVVKSLNQGNYQVVFDYEYQADEFRIVSARVIKEGLREPLYASHYSYSSDGRLCSVKLPSGNEVTITYKNNAVIVATR